MIRNFWTVLRADLQRAVFSGSFLAGLAATVAIFCFGAIGINLSGVSAAAAFNDIYKYSNISQLLFLAATFAYSAAFCVDWQTRFAFLLIIRSDMTAYMLSKCIAAAVAGGLAVMTGALLFIIGLCATLSEILPSAEAIAMQYSFQAFGDLLAAGAAGRFFLAYLGVIFLQAAFFSSLGLAVSGYLPNKYAAYITPFLLCFMLNQVANVAKLPVWLDPVKLAAARVTDTPAAVILYRTAASFLTFTVICDAVFIRRAKRRLADG